MYIILIAHIFKLKNYMNYLTLQNISLPPYVNTALICEYFQSHKKISTLNYLEFIFHFLESIVFMISYRKHFMVDILLNLLK